MQDWLIQITNLHPILTYGIIIFISFVEGPLLGMVCGLLIRLGDFHFIPVYIALMVGDLIGDTFWYIVGYHFAGPFLNRFGDYFSITEEGVATVERIFHKHQDWILLLSKVTMGFGFALVTLVTAGIVKIPFKRYIAMNAIGQFVWTGIIVSIGYTIGGAYESVGSIFSKVSVLVLIVVFFFALLGFSKYVKGQMVKNLPEA